MRIGALSACCIGAALSGAAVQAQPPADGPRLIGRGTSLTPTEQISYAVKSELCPQELRASLVGGDLTDREVILVAVIAGLAVAVIIVAVAD